jgi:predicted small secreted protein
MMKRTLAVSGWVLAGLLSACGGGGGGGNDVPDGPYDVAAAWQNAVATPYSYTATGQVDGETLSVTWINGTPFGPAN